MIINKDLFLLYPVTIQYVPVPAGRLNNFFVIMLKIVTFIHEKTLNMLYYFIGNWVSEWLLFNVKWVIFNLYHGDKNKPEALKSLYRSPGYKKNQLVLCKNYVLQW